MATAKQINANKKNAQKSTGPVTAIGKVKSSRNAVKHGILSNKLILMSESAEDYEQLLDGLVSSINVPGTLGFSIIEKIAIILWKQRRSIQAESAEIDRLNSNCPERITEIVNEDFGYYYQHEITAEEIEGLDEEYCQWCDEVLFEVEIVEEKYDEIQDWTDLEDIAPKIYQKLMDGAGQDKAKVNDFLAENNDGLYDHIELLKAYCAKYKRRAKVSKIADMERNRIPALTSEIEKRYSRYQTALNNEFHKLIKTLRDVKKMQSMFVDAEAIDDGVENKGGTITSV